MRIPDTADHSGETTLSELLVGMRPALDSRTFVFAHVQPSKLHDYLDIAQMTFHEGEATTVIVEQAEAEARGLEAIYPCRRITLQIHSSLQAVGFLAAILPSLAAAGISVNAVSAYFHDHLFVPVARADEALRILQHLSTPSR